MQATVFQIRIMSLGALTALFLHAGVADPVGSEPGKEGRQAARTAILEEMRSALEAYRSANGSYPDTGGQWLGDCAIFGGLGRDEAGYVPGLVPDYLPALPRDPDLRFPTYDAGFAYRSDGKEFKFMLFHTPEEFPPSNPFEDLARPYWAWQISTPGALDW